MIRYNVSESINSSVELKTQKIKRSPFEDTKSKNLVTLFGAKRRNIMITRYLIIFVISLLVDMFWHIFVAPKLFREQIGHLMGDKVKIYAGLIFYFINAAAILLFVINPAVENKNIMHALFYGGFLGFSMYSTYNFTNLALLRNWPIKLTIIDLAWGAFAAAATSVISFKLIQYF